MRINYLNLWLEYEPVVSGVNVSNAITRLVQEFGEIEAVIRAGKWLLHFYPNDSLSVGRLDKYITIVTRGNKPVVVVDKLGSYNALYTPDGRKLSLAEWRKFESDTHLFQRYCAISSAEL